MKGIYLGTIALEKNRWAEGRRPSYKVSDFLSRAKRDGFSGIGAIGSKFVKFLEPSVYVKRAVKKIFEFILKS